MRKVTPREQAKLRFLESVLLSCVPASRFCVDGKRQNMRMCIAPGEAEWYVFFREGQLAEDVTIHSSFSDAALQLIHNVAPSTAAEELMRNVFLNGEK